MNASFEWAPFLPWAFAIFLAVAAVSICALAWWKKMPDFYWRGGLFLLLIAIILNPISLNEIRQGLPDKLVIVVDDSPSQKIGKRDETAEAALKYLKDRVAASENLEAVVIHTSADPDSAKGESTKLFSALRGALAAIPLPQVAGTVLITDGQVHDVPADLGILEKLTPFHVMLTGKKDEFDRKVTIVSAPKYGLLNEEIRVKVRVDEFGKNTGAQLPIAVFQDGKKTEEAYVTAGEVREFSFKLNHPGQNVFEFTVAEARGELTANNNTAPLIVNGVRDRLKVLLVSGSPHMGERAWRNLLKSDPGLDLVHFTILRSPAAMDPTPSHELSLIVFPVEELFAAKIDDFDLIIFDKYQQYGLMMPYYFTNIENFIRKGGAFLMAMGSDKPENFISTTSLANVLPVLAREGNSVMEGAYRAQLTDMGRKHPVTADLTRQFDKRQWGEWYTQVDVSQKRGQTLMTGMDGRPLLVIDKVDQGRIAVLTSDNVWLWSKGGAAGGPYTELLRNVAHWLMKEPELEDDYIKAEVRGTTITVSQRDIGDTQKTVDMTRPSGDVETIALKDREGGWTSAKVEAVQNGIYAFTQGDKKAFAVVGTALNEEFADVHTTEEKLKPVADATGGGIVWFSENPRFDLRPVSPSASEKGGESWLGIKQNNAFTVSAVDSRELFPNWLILIVILSAAVWSWWRESGTR